MSGSHGGGASNPLHDSGGYHRRRHTARLLWPTDGGRPRQVSPARGRIRCISTDAASGQWDRRGPISRLFVERRCLARRQRCEDGTATDAPLAVPEDVRLLASAVRYAVYHDDGFQLRRTLRNRNVTARPGRARAETLEPNKTRSTPMFNVLEKALSREPESEAAAFVCRGLIKALSLPIPTPSPKTSSCASRSITRSALSASMIRSPRHSRGPRPDPLGGSGTASCTPRTSRLVAHLVGIWLPPVMPVSQRGRCLRKCPRGPRRKIRQ